jgi:membrane protein involved in colicin uptake
MTDPAPIPNARPYDLFAETINDLYEEARHFADGEPITTPGQAEAVQALMRQIQQAEKDADEERKREAKPFDDGKAEVQERYNALIAPLSNKKPGKTALAIKALKETLAPYLQNLADEQAAAAKAARDAADKAAQDAADAMRAAQGNLAAREAAEATVEAASEAQRAAKTAETARPQATGQGRAATLRTTYKPTMIDRREALRHFFAIDRRAFDAVVMKLAEDQVAAGKRGVQVPGFRIDAIQTVV